jgi:hypothetical protein
MIGKVGMACYSRNHYSQLAQIATIEGCTVKEVQEKLGIDLDD